MITTKSFSKFLFVIILFVIFPVFSFAQVVINEVQISPIEERFIELYNASDLSIDLTGWYIQRKTTSSFGSLVTNPNFENKTIDAHGYFVISKNSLNDSDIVFSDLTLTESNTIQIKDSDGKVINKVGWGSANDCDGSCPANPSEGKSIQRIVSGWVVASPTPGVANVTSDNSSNSDNQNTSGEVLGASTESSSSSGSAASSGGGTTDKVSSLNAQLEILAGSDRTTSPGSPIWFQATVKKNTTGASPELNWSFGDGNVGVGPLVSHTYKYPGDYAVVLSAGAGDIFSVSRLKVKVAESNLSVSDGGEYLEISNNGSTEINLFNWKIENNGKGFIFQPNTIVLAKSSIKLDKSLLMMKGLDNSLGLSLKNSLKEEVFAVAPVVPIKEVDLKEISKNLGNIKKEFSVVQEKANNLGLVSANVFPTVSTNEKIETDSINSPQATTSAENIIYEAPKNPGIFSRTWNFLIGMLH